MDNMYNMTHVGKNQMNQVKRLQNQSASYLAEDKLAREAAEKKLNEDASKMQMSAARLSYANKFAASKNRVNTITEAMKYNDMASVAGMSAVMTKVVCEALLLDEEELAKIVPDYKDTIYNLVEGYLKNADINQNVSDIRTRTLMEYVFKKLPTVEEGKDLTEEEIAQYILEAVPFDADKAIKDLSGSVAGRVANLMEKEQKQQEPIPTKEEIINGVIDGSINEREYKKICKMLDPDTIEEIEAAIEQEGASEAGQVAAEPPVEDDAPVEEAPAEDPNAVVEQPPMDDAQAGEPVPTKQIQMLPDGTMNINVFEGNNMLSEANANQVHSNSIIGQMVRQYLSKHAVKMTWRINKHIAATERLFRDDPHKIKYAMVAMPYNYDIYGGQNAEGTRIILFLDDKICVYGKGILSGGKAKEYKLSDIHDVIANEGLVWTKIIINYKQTNNAGESQVILGRINKNATNEVTDFLKSYAGGKFHIQQDLTKETPRQGLFETLAVNEATHMIEEGKEYNPDTCLAKAIMYVTVTEAMDEAGLMEVGFDEYKHIVNAAGGTYLKEIYDTRGMKQTGRSQLNRSKRANDVTPGKIIKADGSTIHTAWDPTHNQTKQFASEAERDTWIENEKIRLNKPNKSGAGRPVQKESATLNEGVLFSGNKVPVGQLDFAERIRQRKLLREQESTTETLHD